MTGVAITFRVTGMVSGLLEAAGALTVMAAEADAQAGAVAGSIDTVSVPGVVVELELLSAKADSIPL